jgi:molecular chaperone Hsp33
VSQIADRLEELPPVAALLNTGQTPEAMMAALFGGLEYRILETRPLRWQCSCSYERTRQALVALGRTEIESLLSTEGQAVVDCHFCRQRYVFDEEALTKILRQMSESGE